LIKNSTKYYDGVYSDLVITETQNYTLNLDNGLVISRILTSTWYLTDDTFNTIDLVEEIIFPLLVIPSSIASVKE
jgi:hypothetical protein